MFQARNVGMSSRLRTQGLVFGPYAAFKNYRSGAGAGGYHCDGRPSADLIERMTNANAELEHVVIFHVKMWTGYLVRKSSIYQ